MRQTEHQYDFWHHKHQRTQKGWLASLFSRIDGETIQRELYLIAQIPPMLLFFGIVFQDAPTYIIARTLMCYFIARSVIASRDKYRKKKAQQLEFSKELYDRK